tara:strand:- start:34847 stop:35209 length:363 start_codon:yes stop_codon:yes gene_type:complete
MRLSDAGGCGVFWYCICGTALACEFGRVNLVTCELVVDPSTGIVTVYEIERTEMLTRKHMNALAEVVKDFPGVGYEAQSGDKAYLAAQLANICANSNPAFDYRRFFEACEVDAERAWSYA